jgi:hypothetical protein
MLRMIIIEDSYLLETLHVAKHVQLLVVDPVACNTCSSIICTLPVPSVATPFSHS